MYLKKQQFQWIYIVQWKWVTYVIYLCKFKAGLNQSTFMITAFIGWLGGYTGHKTGLSFCCMAVGKRGVPITSLPKEKKPLATVNYCVTPTYVGTSTCVFNYPDTNVICFWKNCRKSSNTFDLNYSHLCRSLHWF
jgi:hypothetical protein